MEEHNQQNGQTVPSEFSPGSSEIRKACKRAAFSVGLNLTLALAKGSAGVLAGSSALLSDAIHSGTDVIASGAAYLGLWIAGRQHPSFPYGLYKAETIATLVTSGAIILAGYEIARRAILGPASLPDVSIALPVALASLVITFAFGLYQLRMGKRLHSPALSADARDYLVDGFSTALVVVSLIGTAFGLPLDRWAAMAVAVFVFWSGGQLLWRALRDLMDEAIDRGTQKEIIGLVESHPRVEKVEQCLSRAAGGRFIVDLDVIVRTHSHELADRISQALEHDIRSKFSRVIMARIKTHVHRSEHIRRLTPVTKPDGPPAEHIARAPWFLLETIDRTSSHTINQEYLKNPHEQEERKRGFLVGHWLLELNPDQIVVAEKKEGTTSALLKEAGVEILDAEDLTNKGDT
jgi:cation diffusion facilitator family transporter